MSFVPGRANQILESCGSTNDVARELAEQGAPHGTWISARNQEAGRGRMGRKWEGRSGNLFLSVVVRISNKALWTWVPLAGAVGVAGALREMNPNWDVRIKWPNDLWIGDAKLGGLLAEAVGGGQRESFIILGLGLNCLQAPEGLDQNTVSLSSLSARNPREVDSDQVRMPVLQGILDSLARLENEGTADARWKYEDWAVLRAGSSVMWQDSETGVVQGLGTSAELLVVDRSGREQALFAEDVKVRAAR